MKRLAVQLAAAASALAFGSVATTAVADSFVNGNFESGNLAGWEQGGGSWFGGPYPVPNDYFPGGGSYNAGAIANSITNVGFDSRTDNKLRTVYAGAHSARVNDPVNNYSVSAIRQRVDNYSDNLIGFAYAAVLQDSHTTTDSDAFIIRLDDLTSGLNLLTVNVNSAATPASFTRSSSGWFYTDWTTYSFDVAGAGLKGHDFLLTLLANDCPYGGHAGYAYLDGFGGVIPDPGGGAIPEPATWAMMIIGFGAVGSVLRRRKIAFA
jgi:hypothetical protein